MTPEELEIEAQRLYDERLRKPMGWEHHRPWSAVGEHVKSVYRDAARRQEPSRQIT